MSEDFKEMQNAGSLPANCVWFKNALYDDYIRQAFLNLTTEIKNAIEELFETGHDHICKGKYKEATIIFKSAFNYFSNPYNSTFLALRAFGYYYVKNNYDGAISICQAILPDISPYAPDFLFLLAELYWCKGDGYGAVITLLPLLDIDESDKEDILRCKTATFLIDCKEKALIPGDERDKDIILHLGNMNQRYDYMSLREYRDDSKDYAALNIECTSVIMDIDEHRRFMYSNTNLTSRGKEHLFGSYDIQTYYKDKNRLIFLKCHAFANLIMENYKLALKYLATIIEMGDRCYIIFALLLRSQSYYDRRKNDEAQKDISEIFVLDPENVIAKNLFEDINKENSSPEIIDKIINQLLQSPALKQYHGDIKKLYYINYAKKVINAMDSKFKSNWRDDTVKRNSAVYLMRQEKVPLCHIAKILYMDESTVSVVMGNLTNTNGQTEKKLKESREIISLAKEIGDLIQKDIEPQLNENKVDQKLLT
jgi:hypothetical protein